MPISSVEAVMKKKWNMKSCVDTKPQSATTTKISDRKTHIELELKASRSTIRRKLKKAVTMTTPANKHPAVKQQGHKAPNSWNKVIWSDESKSELCGHN